jgi:hypothetical protein
LEKNLIQSYNSFLFPVLSYRCPFSDSLNDKSFAGHVIISFYVIGCSSVFYKGTNKNGVLYIFHKFYWINQPGLIEGTRD